MRPGPQTTIHPVFESRLFRLLFVFIWTLTQTTSFVPVAKADYAALMSDDYQVPEIAYEDYMEANAQTLEAEEAVRYETLDVLRRADFPLKPLQIAEDGHVHDEHCGHLVHDGHELHIAPAVDEEMIRQVRERFFGKSPISTPAPEDPEDELVYSVGTVTSEYPTHLMTEFENDNPLSLPKPGDLEDELVYDIGVTGSFYDRDLVSAFEDESPVQPLDEATTVFDYGYSSQPLTLVEVLEAGELRSDYASAVVLEGPLRATDIRAYRNLDFEVAVAVVDGTLVAFTSGQRSEIGMTSDAYRYIQERAAFMMHNHPSGFDGPSDLDLTKAVAEPALEYILDTQSIHAFNKGGKQGEITEEELIRLMEEAMAGAVAGEAAAREALNIFIEEQDRFNEAHEMEKTVFRGDVEVPTPGNSKYLYLNFHGQTFSSWGEYNNVSLGAYDRDGDTSSFSIYELDTVSEIVGRMQDKFSPFDLEIFTSFDYLRSQVSFAPRNAMEVVIGSGSSASKFGQEIGGVAYLDSWSSSFATSVLAYSDNLGNGHAKYTTEAAAHEAGHGFGLYHQADYSSGGNLLSSYHYGTGYAAPMMGVSYYSDYGLWASGPAYSATAIQDDLSRITRSRNNLDYRLDDHGGSVAGASPMQFGSGSNVYSDGIIETINDVDYYAFSSAGGTISVDVSAPFYGMMDPKVEIYDEDGNVVAFQDVRGRSEFFTVDLPAGNYYAAVSSAGVYEYDSVINGYGYHLGEYTIDLELPPGSFNRAPVLNPLGNKVTDEETQLSFTVSATDFENDDITLSASGLPAGATFDPATGVFSWVPDANQAGDYQVTFYATDGITQVSQTIDITVHNTVLGPEDMRKFQLSGGAALNTDTKKFGEGSLLLANKGDYLNVEQHEDFSFGTGDFTVEFQFNPTVERNHAFFSGAGGNSDWMRLFYNGNRFEWGVAGSSTKKFPAPQLAKDEWHHVAVSRENGTVRLFVNGELIGEVQDSGAVTNNSGMVRLGEWSGLNALGYLDEVRISSNARYTQSFNVSDSEFARDPQTKFLLHMSAAEISQGAESLGGTGNTENTDDQPENPGDDEPEVTNTAPTLHPIGNQSVNENETLSFTVSGNDANGDVLTYSASGLPAGATLDSATGEFNWTPDGNAAGVYNITFSVSDGEEEASETIQITVEDVPDDPDGPTQAGHAFALSGGSQLDTDTKKFGEGSLLLANKGDYVDVEQSDDFSFGTGDFTVEFQFNPSIEKNHAFFSGQGGNSDWMRFFYNGSRFEWGIAGERTKKFPAPKLAQGEWHHVAVTRENGTVRIFVNGEQIGADESAPESITNTSGSVRFGEWSGLNALGYLDEVRISSTARYTQNFSVSTSELSRDNQTEFLLHMTAAEIAEGAELVGEGDEPDNNDDNDQNENTAPTLNPIGNQNVNENETLSFTVSGNDTDGDTLAYSATGLPAGATLDSATGEFNWTPDSNAAGVYNITISVSDGEEEASETIQITVVDVPDGPDGPTQPGNTFELNGGAQLDTNMKKFGEGSLRLANKGDYVDVDQNDDFSFGTGDFTVEFQFNPSEQKNHAFFSGQGGNSDWMRFFYNGSRFEWGIAGERTKKFDAPPLTVGEWHHVAVSRENGTVRIFVNGQLIGEERETGSITNTNGAVRFGEWSGLNAMGHLDEVRISNTARYTQDFSGSNSQFVRDAQTTFLLHMTSEEINEGAELIA